MRIYVESNFILELALRQAEESACRKLLAATKDSRVDLVLPSFCVAEPVRTLHGRAAKRGVLRQDLDQDIALLGRSDPYKPDAERLRNVTTLLARAIEEEASSLRETLLTVLESSRVLSIEIPVLKMAQQNEDRFGMDLADAIVCASVQLDLAIHPVDEACFVTRNKKDFDDPDLSKEFASAHCKLLFSFEASVQFALGR